MQLKIFDITHTLSGTWNEAKIIILITCRCEYNNNRVDAISSVQNT